MPDVAAHDQRFTHSYVVHYPEHAPREDDPHKHDFEEWKRRRREDGTWWCDFAHMSGAARDYPPHPCGHGRTRWSSPPQGDRSWR